MSTWRIYCTKVSSRRYRVNHSLMTSSGPDAGVCWVSYDSEELHVLSPRHYRRGVIINPTKVIKSLIAARAAA